MDTFSHPDQVNLEFGRGIDEALTGWFTRSTAAVKNRQALENFGRRVLTRVQVSHPEAKGSFGLHQDGELFQLTIYASSTHWDLDELVSDFASAHLMRRLHMILILEDLEALEEA